MNAVNTKFVHRYFFGEYLLQSCALNSGRFVFFDQGLNLYLFSGDYEEENDGHFRVFGPDEMIFLFFNKPDFQYFGFLDIS